MIAFPLPIGCTTFPLTACPRPTEPPCRAFAELIWTLSFRVLGFSGRRMFGGRREERKRRLLCSQPNRQQSVERRVPVRRKRSDTPSERGKLCESGSVSFGHFLELPLHAFAFAVRALGSAVSLFDCFPHEFLNSPEHVHLVNSSCRNNSANHILMRSAERTSFDANR